ncbi:MAG TPA: DNA internalization-related competence protein ComEC/Rec2 [Ignavibacteria bacterium]|nr:DNA internalization-related competence protein ComEC/Rec2 [Ignavibacteria bacterium]
MNTLSNVPALKFALILSLGIITGSMILFDTFILTIVIFTILIFLIIYFWRKEDIETNICLYLTFLLIFITGIYRANTGFYFIPDNSVKFFPETQRKDLVSLTGIIKDIPESDSMSIKFTLECENIKSQSDTFYVTGDIRCAIRKNMFSKTEENPPGLFAGDKIILKGKLSEPAGKRNPGEFDYRRYLEIHDIYKTFYANGYNNVTVVSGNNLNFLYQKIIFPAKQYVLRIIDKFYDSDEASYLKGLVTGERSGISEDMKNDFVNAGVMHLIAVSGLNVAYIIIFVMLTLSVLRVSLLPKIIITISFLIFYCIFTGSSASIVRASIMGIIVLTALLIERKILFYNSLGVAAMLILLFDPKQLFDAGFILSFSATFSMVILYTRFEQLFLTRLSGYGSPLKKFTLALMVLLFTSLAAQIGTIPITANYFGRISLISLLANVIAVPLANLSLAIGFLQIFLSVISDNLSSLAAETNGLLLSCQLSFIKWCASLEFAFIKVRDFNYADMIFFYGTVILIFTIKSRREIYARILLCFLLAGGNFIFNFEMTKRLRITFMDIGQGDCALIQTPDGSNILVDCGQISFTSDSGERTIIPYLERCGISRIDLLVITHLHMDHIGGINSILKNIEVGKILDSGQKYNTGFISTMDSLIKVKNVKREVVSSGDHIDDMKDIRMYFLYPGNNYRYKDLNYQKENLNNGSVTFILKYGDTDFLFTGDAEKESEEVMVRQYSDFLKSDVLKAAHHGSITSTTIPFILKTKPELAVISCGKYNKFNHPSDIILKRLETSGAKVFRTDTDAAILMESDGKDIEIIDWK